MKIRASFLPAQFTSFAAAILILSKDDSAGGIQDWWREFDLGASA
jgi:hypothetical protein